MTWECHPDCKGECCGIVNMPSALFFAHQESIQKQPKDIIHVPKKRYHDPEIVVPITEDFKCCFLNRETSKCAIYPFRMEVCKIFGVRRELLCSYVDMTGRFRNLKDRARVQKFMDERTQKKFEFVKRKRGITKDEETVIINQVTHDSQSG